MKPYKHDRFSVSEICLAAEKCRKELDDMNYYEGTQKRDACIERHIQESVDKALERVSTFPKTIYLVKGECGDYSDWETWIVATYADKESAELHSNNANARNKEIGGEDRDVRGRYINQYDHLHPHNLESMYSVVEVKLFTHPDEYLEAHGF